MRLRAFAPVLSGDATTTTDQWRRWIAARLAGEPGRYPPIPPDVAELTALAEAEGVAALLACRLGHDFDPPADRELAARLHAMELARAALLLHREQEVVRCLQLLREAGLDFILLKGEALAYSIYAEPHLRSRSDVDIMVDGREAMEQAWAVLRDAGYARKNTLQGKFTGFQFACHRQLADGVEIQFDIHREISDFTWFARRLPFAHLRANTEVVVLGGLEVRGLDRRYSLLHACVHRLTNKPHGTANRLIWLYDIHLLARAQATQWSAFVSLARDKGMARVCLQGLEAAHQYFNTDADLVALAAAADSEAVALSEASTRRGLYLADWLCNPGLGNKLTQLREHLLPSPQYMHRKYGIRHRLLLPWYYVLRILQGLCRPGH